ncbi:unnamed protein product [Ixodes persulcatus]
MLTLRQKLLFLPGQTSYLWICSDTFWTNKEEEASLNPGPKNEKERLQKVQEYLELFDHQDSSLRRGKWTELEDMIYRAHKTAVKSSQTSYTDPGTGFKVFTGLFHYLRGYCCGCGCRHGPMGLPPVYVPAIQLSSELDIQTRHQKGVMPLSTCECQGRSEREDGVQLCLLCSKSEETIGRMKVENKFCCILLKF